jgi:hypothetical protein
MGHTVREAHGVHWYNVFSRSWICFPLETQLDPAQIDVDAVIGDFHGGIVRYCCRVESGAPGFRHVAAGNGYSLATLQPKHRNQTRQGLQHCSCSQADPHELAREGIELHAETLLRQGRRLPDNYESWWKKYFHAVADCPAATAWTCRHEGVLAAYLISFRIGNVENICIVRSREELLKFRPNNALLFTFLQQKLASEHTSEVCIGLQSLQRDMASLDSFKRGMGFTEKPIGQRIEVRTPLGLQIPRFAARIVAKAADSLNHELAARLAGALRLYDQQPHIRRAA